MNPYSCKRRRLARYYGVLAVASIVGGILAGATSRRFGAVFLIAGLAGYLLHGKRATALYFGRRLTAAPFPFAPLRMVPATDRSSGDAWAPVGPAAGAIASNLRLFLDRGARSRDGSARSSAATSQRGK